MLDNVLIALIRTVIVAGLAVRGLSAITVKQANQPTQVGVNTGSTIYLSKISDHRYGFLKRDDVWNDMTHVMDHTETQQYETVFQVNALAIQNPADTASLTASDIVNITAEILQSDVALATFRASDVGIERITDIRNPAFSDDTDRFEYSPSFDFTLTHKQVRITNSPTVNTFKYGIFPI